MWHVIAHCRELDTSTSTQPPKHFYILQDDSYTVPWHRLVIEQNGNILAGDEKVVKVISDFKQSLEKGT